MSYQRNVAALAVIVIGVAGAMVGMPGETLASPTVAGAQPSVPVSVQERLAQPITADFQDVDFVSAMEFLAQGSGLNIIVSEKAKTQGKPVTVHLVETPLHHALEYLLKGQGLLFRLDGGTIWVATRDEMEGEPLETRVFFLNQGPGLFAAFEPLSDTRESVALQATAVREMKTIKDILSEVIPEVGQSTMLLDERSGALIVTNAPYYLEQVERLLATLDVTPVQVLIEARFVEVTFKDTKEWSLDSALTGDVTLSKKTASNNTKGAGVQLSSSGSSITPTRGTEIDFADFENQKSGNGLNLTFQGILNGTQYQAVLHALAKNEKTKTLSAPRVTTLNNQTATIKIVTEFVYATQYQATVVREDLNGDGDFTDVVSGTRETRFVNAPQGFVTKDLGILLNVTPSVGHDLRTITLALKPEVSERKTNDSFGGEISLPRFTERTLETSVVIGNGDTVMLGGLMKDTTTKTTTRVPILGSLPLLGTLFRKEDDSVERSNLLIFVTAQLVDPTGARLAFTDF